MECLTLPSAPASHLPSTLPCSRVGDNLGDRRMPIAMSSAPTERIDRADQTDGGHHRDHKEDVSGFDTPDAVTVIRGTAVHAVVLDVDGLQSAEQVR